MTPQFSSENFPFKFLSILKFSTEEASAAASYFSSFDSSVVTAFDRIMWSALSAGQMPSQLFPFPGETIDCTAAVLTTGEFTPSCGSVAETYSISSVEVSGTPGEQFEPEEDFEESMFMMLLKSSEPITVDGMLNFFLKTDKGSLLLCAGYNLYPAEDVLENQSSAAGYYMMAPSLELRSQLEERVSDTERIHLDENIKGIHL